MERKPLAQKCSQIESAEKSYPPDKQAPRRVSNRVEALGSFPRRPAFVQLRTVARYLEVRGREERIVNRAHVHVPRVRTRRMRSRHRRDRGIAAIQICIDHSDLEKPLIRIHRNPSRGCSTIVI